MTRVTTPALPGPVAELVAELSVCEGVRAVTLGGSRSAGTADDRSDWDIGVYYEGYVDLSPVSRRGELHPPGSWGRFMNGGAWLDTGGFETDVVLRDVGTVTHWAERARRGDFEIDNLLGHLAGYPSYTLLAEVALSTVLEGRIGIDTGYPEELSSVAARRWAFHRDFSLEYAMMHARRDDRAAAVGSLVRAGFEESHRRAAVSGTWVVNEKRLLASTGVDLDGLVTRPVDTVSLVESASDLLRAAG